MTALLPYVGAWKISIRAYDAMGNLSGLSAPVTSTSTVPASLVFLPVLGK